MRKLKRDRRAEARRGADRGRWQQVCRRAEGEARKLVWSVENATRKQRRAS